MMAGLLVLVKEGLGRIRKTRAAATAGRGGNFVGVDLSGRLGPRRYRR